MHRSVANNEVHVPKEIIVTVAGRIQDMTLESSRAENLSIT
jgi:hypothetical protein